MIFSQTNKAESKSEEQKVEIDGSVIVIE